MKRTTRRRVRWRIRGLLPTLVVLSVLEGLLCLSPAHLCLPFVFGWVVLFYTVLPCVSRFFAAQNCLTFAIRLRVRRGGAIVVRKWYGWIPNFGVDFGDRIVYLCPPPFCPRMYIKTRAATVPLSWDQV